MNTDGYHVYEKFSVEIREVRSHDFYAFIYFMYWNLQLDKHHLLNSFKGKQYQRTFKALWKAVTIRKGKVHCIGT